jgi:DNA-binding SARP family transcriptional activator
VIDQSAWHQRRAGELFRLLLLTPQHTLSRDQIIDALWPDKSIRQALPLFHRATSQLRRVLEPDLPDKFPSRYLEVDKGRVTLHLPLGSSIDFEAFEQHVCDERWAAALDVYRGELCPDDRYADWAAAPRERFMQLHLRVLSIQARLELNAGAPEKAIDLCRHALSIEPWQEQAALIGMQACLALNDRAGAIRLYRDFERTLGEDLGIAPQPELQTLYRQLTSAQ